MNETQKNIVMSITEQLIQLYENLLFDEKTSENIGNMYFEVTASILSSVNATIINAFSKDVSDNGIEYKVSVIEISKAIIREIMGSTDRMIKQSEMH